MAMEPSETLRRLSSNSSPSNNRWGQRTSRLRDPTTNRPLRSVDESATLLASPGPLESMLKTTTETGDIGIFSIRPSSAAEFRPPRISHGTRKPRPSLDDHQTRWARSSRGSCSLRRDDRKRLPSHRDTASEIISMYGSGSDSRSSSCLSSFSPLDDEFRRRYRSYSLTTGNARQHPGNKSTGTMVQASPSILQRPRSPFPYPTRLKRPGVRPASPALADNGSVDYSRMIEIDRISYRTVHGSYKPTYPHWRQCPPPLSTRMGSGHPNYPLVTLSPSTLRQGELFPRRGHHRQFNSSWSQVASGYMGHSSRRSTSLASFPYRPSSASAADGSSTSQTRGGVLYYDYSEEFDDEARPIENPDMQAIAQPFAPVPQHVPSFNKPLVLREENQARLDAVVDLSISANDPTSVFRGGAGSVPSLADDIGETRHHEGRGIGCVQTYGIPDIANQILDFDNPSMTAEAFVSSTDAAVESQPQDERGHTQTPTLNSQPTGSMSVRQGQHIGFSNNSTVELHDINSSTCQGCDTRPVSPLVDSLHHFELDRGDIRRKAPQCDQSVMDQMITKRGSAHGEIAALIRNSLHNSLDPGLSDLATLVSSFESIKKSPLDRKDIETETCTENAKAIAKDTSSDTVERPCVLASVEALNDCGSSGPIEQTLICREQKHPATSQAMLQTRPRNTPRVMKTLPPLPIDERLVAIEAGVTAEMDLSISFAPFQLTTLMTPHTNVDPATPRSCEAKQATNRPQTSPLQRPYRLKQSLSQRVHQLKKPNLGSTLQTPRDSMTLPGLVEARQEVLASRTDRIKTGVLGYDFNSTRAKSTNEWAMQRYGTNTEQQAILPERLENLCTSSKTLSGANRRWKRQFTTGGTYKDHGRMASEQASTQCKTNPMMPIPRVCSTRTYTTRPSTPTKRDDPGEVSSFHSDLSSSLRQRGLRKKISKLGIRGFKSRLGLRDRFPKQDILEGYGSHGIQPSKTGGTLQSTQSVQGPSWADRWFHGARHAVRTCVHGRQRPHGVPGNTHV